jgi:hypothetical protein
MQNNQNSQTIWEPLFVWFVLGAVIGLISTAIGRFIKMKFDLMISNFLDFYNSFEVFPFENTLYFKISIISLLVIIILLYFYQISIIIHSKIQTIKETKIKEAERIERNISWLEKLSRTKVDSMNLNQLKNLLSQLRRSKNLMNSSYAEKYKEELREKWEECTRRMTIEAHKERIQWLKEEEVEKIEQIKEYEKIEKEKQRNLETKREEILRRLESSYNYVFKKDELSNPEIEALKSEGFSLENEFCVFEKKRINVLIKSPTNHSNHHTFLVWSVKRLLEKNRKISHIDEHLSVDADITFKSGEKYFAIEVETGNLLRKKDQLIEKIGYLKRKYSDRWIFLVSNKELLSKYNKFGLTATRKDMDKKLKKLLEDNQK